MPVRYIHPRNKDSNLPSFVIPQFTGNDEAPFYPFKRLAQPMNVYEILKTFILTLTVFPLRVVCFLIYGFFAAFLGIIGTISYDPQNLNDLAAPLPFWRRICFAVNRFSGRWALLCYGFYHISTKQLSYKQMKEMYDYVPPMDIKYDENGNEIHPRTYVKVCNHLGFADILYLLWFMNASFVSKAAIKDVIIAGPICTAIQSLYVEKGKSTTKALVERLRFTHKMHEKMECKGCSLDLSNLCIFPEGTTTNGNDLIMFRTGVFNAGLPITPIVMKCKWKNVNTAWESIYFKTLTWRVMTQFFNSMEVIVGAPYIPTEAEKADSALYAYNVNVLMAKMMGMNNEGRKADIYLINRNAKVHCYHRHCVYGTDLREIHECARQQINADPLFEKYLNMIRSDERYAFDEGKDVDEVESGDDNKSETRDREL